MKTVKNIYLTNDKEGNKLMYRIAGQKITGPDGTVAVLVQGVQPMDALATLEDLEKTLTLFKEALND